MNIFLLMSVLFNIFSLILFIFCYKYFKYLISEMTNLNELLKFDQQYLNQLDGLMNDFSEHLDHVNKMEVFRGDVVLSNLLQHANLISQTIKSELKKGEIIEENKL